MASPSSPTHGKKAAIYRLRPNGFNGAGGIEFNDLTWGSGFNGAATAEYVITIASEATPDTFDWTKNGGGGASGVAITGSAQTLDDSQTITFVNTTGHTAGDKWSRGNFKDEATTESGAAAQITTASHRILNPNSPPTFTDDGGESVLITDLTRGQATFTGNVGNVDVDGNDGFVVIAGMQLVGYLFGWEFTPTLELASIARCGQDWEEFVAGQAGAVGSSNMYYVGNASFWDMFEQQIGTQSLGVEFFTTEEDRIFTAGTSDWANSGGGTAYASFDKTGDLSLTADAIGDYCEISFTNIGTALVEGVRYRFTYDHTEAVAGFEIWLSGTTDQKIGDAVPGTGQTLEFVADEAYATSDALQIRARASAIAEGDFDNLSLMQLDSQQYHFLQLFNYDPDADQTGDHWNGWITFTNLTIDDANVGAVIMEKVTFDFLGSPSFISNT